MTPPDANKTADEAVAREPVSWATCWECGGDGEVLTCIDDMCRGAGECMHGDGYGVCRPCKGTGELPVWEEPDYD